MLATIQWPLLAYLAEVVYWLVIEPCADHIKWSHGHYHCYTADHSGG